MAEDNVHERLAALDRDGQIDVLLAEIKAKKGK